MSLSPLTIPNDQHGTHTRYFRNDALDGGARRRREQHAAGGPRAGGAVRDLLVPALRVCAAARFFEGGCGGPDAEIFRAFPGEELPRWAGRGARALPRIPAGGAETFPGE